MNTLEAEKAILGSIIYENSCYDEIAHLSPSDFFTRTNQVLFEIIQEMLEANKPVDYITINKALAERGVTVEPGYVVKLDNYGWANVGFYADIVKKDSRRRKLWAYGVNIVEKAKDEVTDIDVLLQESEKELLAINHDVGTFARIGKSNVMSKIEQYVGAKNKCIGTPSYFEDLDEKTTGFMPRDFIVIGARPSVGKTAFALSIALRQSYDFPVGFFSLEMSAEAIYRRLLSMISYVSNDVIRPGKLEYDGLKRLEDAAQVLDKLSLLIYDKPDTTLRDIKTNARRMVHKEGVRIIYVDYAGLVKVPGISEKRLQVMEVGRELKQLARELNIPIVTLSQVGRQAQGRMPTLADLRESGSLEEDADLVMFLHRDNTDPEPRTNLHIAKQRNGVTGYMDLAFLPKLTLYKEYFGGS